MSKKGSITKSFSYALQGIRITVKNEPNFRTHLVVALFSFILAVILNFTLFELLILILTIGLVLTLELVNTAFEEAVNLLHPDIHPQAKTAKDVSAAAVFVSAVIALLVGSILFLPKILLLIF